MDKIIKNCFNKLDNKTQKLYLQKGLTTIDNINENLIYSLSADEAYEIIKANPKNFEFLTENHLCNEKIVYEAVKYDGEYISRVANELRKIEKIAKTAIKSNPKAIMYLPTYLSTEKEVIKCVLKEPSVFLGLTYEQKANKKLINKINNKFKGDTVLETIVREEIKNLQKFL